MQVQNKLKIFSSHNVMTVVIECSGILKKTDTNSPAMLLLEKAEKFLTFGEYCHFNPTYWKIANGKIRDEIPEWKSLLVNELTSSPGYNLKVTDLDNKSNVVEVSSEISLLVANCYELPDELIKEMKCATVHTAYGPVVV